MSKTDIARDLALGATAIGAAASAITTPDVPSISAAATASLGLLAALLSHFKAASKAQAIVTEAQATIPLVAAAAPVIVPVVAGAVEAATAKAAAKPAA